MVRRVKQRAGDRAKVVAGVGSNDTRHAVEMAGLAADAGADALLLVSPVLQQADPGRPASRTAGPSPTPPTSR